MILRQLAVTSAIAAGLLVVSVGSATPGAAQAATSRVVYVNVFDAGHAPVRDLTAADFQIREDGVVREISSAALSTDPVSVRLLADSSAEAQQVVRELRTALTAFVKTVLAGSPTSEVSLTEFGGALMTTVKFTSKLEDLEKGIPRIFPKPNAGAVLMDAIVDGGKEVARRPGPRRVIVSVNIEPSNEDSQLEAKEIYNDVRKSGATVWALSLQRGPARNAGRDQVLTALANNTGGQRWSVSSTEALEPALQTVAQHLLSTYAVTITRPAGSAAQQTQVAVARPGIRATTLVWSPK